MSFLPSRLTSVPRTNQLIPVKTISYFLFGCLALGPLLSYAQQPGGYYDQSPRPQPPTTSPYERYNSRQTTFRYGLAFPTGGLRPYLTDPSNLNVSLSVENVFTRRFSVGGQVGYLYFKERLPRQIVSSPGQDLSAVQTRTFTALPIMAIGKYYVTGVNAPVRPYAQLGVGGAFVEYANYFGTLADARNGIRFATGAAVGSRFLFGSKGSFGADLQAGVQLIPFQHADVTNATTLQASVGVFYRWW
jgi:hypothetical protein